MLFEHRHGKFVPLHELPAEPVSRLSWLCWR